MPTVFNMASQKRLPSRKVVKQTVSRTEAPISVHSFLSSLNSPSMTLAKTAVTIKSVDAKTIRLSTSSLDSPEGSRRSKDFPIGRPAPSFSTPQNEMVTIHVIEETGERANFVIHKNFLTYHSPYFNAAFCGSFSEAASKEMDFYDTDIKIFGMMVNYTYTQRVEDPSLARPGGDDLILLWLLADKLLMPKLQNVVIHTLEAQSPDVEYSPKIFGNVYDLTLPGSPMRRFLADYFAASSTVKLADAHEYPAEMLADMFLAARDLIHRKGGRFSPQKIKRYLVSEDDMAR